jgi:hypothetical protein
MHPGTMLTDAVRAWPTPLGAEGRRGAFLDPESRTQGGKRGAQLTDMTVNWPTPAARDYKDSEGMARTAIDKDGSIRSREDQLARVALFWATPRTEDGESCGNHPNANDSLTGQTRLWWPTPTAEPYGSSQNGINGIGGAHERPSANTPSLDRMSRSFPLFPVTSTAGAASSASGPTWHRRSADTSWATPRAHCHIQNEKNYAPPSQGGRSSKPGLADQAGASGKAKLNPQFVEYLMGLPLGWTDSGPVAIQSSRWRSRMRSSLWQFVRGFSTCANQRH